MQNTSRIPQMHTRRVVSKYELAEIVGTGSYSQVFKAKHLETNEVVAIKVISNGILAQNLKVKECINNELAIHHVLQPCNNIVRFEELLQTRNNCYFVYEYCGGGTLHELIKRQKYLQEKRALSVFNQLVGGLKILRKHNIMHRDLKPENVLIKGQHFKIADFGFCKQLTVESMTRTMLGSPLYMAPEVLRGQAYTSNADIWSIGVILYEMLYGCCPFESHSIASLINTIDETFLTFDPNISVASETKRFIMKCLQKDCRVRLSWEQLFMDVQKMTERQYEYPVQIRRPQISTMGLPTKLKSQARSFSKQKDQGLLSHQHNSTEISRVFIANHSKYEVFKQNYSRLQQQNKSENKVLFQTTQNLSLHHERSKSINSKNIESSINSSIKEKQQKESKIIYNSFMVKHEACWNILKSILEMLEKKDVKINAFVSLILKAVKKTLERIYSQIKLNEGGMVPVLNMVKYELMQIQKVEGEVDKALIIQLSEDCKGIMMPKVLKLAWNNYQQICQQ